MPGALTGSPSMQQNNACGYRGRGDGDGLMRAVLKWFGADGSGTQVVIEWYARFIRRCTRAVRAHGERPKKVEYLLE